MKFIFLVFFTFSAFADVVLDDAFRREKSFLLAQKESLIKMKTSLGKSHEQRLSKAKKDIEIKQNELSQLMFQNQEHHENLKALEKANKESTHMAGQLEKNGLKISENFSLLRAKLGLPTTSSATVDSVKRFEEILDEAFSLIKNLSVDNWRSHAFLDENDHLIQGEVLIMGLYSAWGKLGDQVFSLVPYNNEFLKVASSVNSDEAYLFAPTFERSGFKAAKSWKESVADAIPGIVMMLIMLMVLGLFIMLARA